MRLSEAYFRLNIDRVMEALKDAGISKIRVRYDGCGDSGMMEGFLDDDGSCSQTFSGGDRLVKVIDQTSRWENGEWVHNEGEREVPLSDAVIGLCEASVERHFPGWEINEGSNGVLTLQVKEGKIFITHNQNYYEDQERPDDADDDWEPDMASETTEIEV